MINADQRIAHWDQGCVALSGVPASSALGQPCYRVVQGRDDFGRTRCGADCPLFKALRRGRTRAGTTIRLRTPGGNFLRARCELTALPSIPGGAIGHLSPLPLQKPPSGQGGPASPPALESRLFQDLAAFATLASSLSGASPKKSLERALDILREATGAEAAEVFLAEPGGKGVVLACHRGLFRHAFSQGAWFSPGEGFPGLVLATGNPALSEHLQEDPRYLRRRVKELGFRRYLCVPLKAPQGIVGTIGLAFRRTDFEMSQALALASWASAPLGLAVQASLASLASSDTAAVNSTDQPEERFLQRLKQVLTQMVVQSQAEGGELTLLAGGGPHTPRRVATGEGQPPACAALLGASPTECPAVARGRGVAFSSPRKSLSLPCQEGLRGGRVYFCLPLVRGREVLALARLWYASQRRTPPTEGPAMAAAMAEAAARTIGDAVESLEAGQRAQAIYREVLGRVRDDGHATSATPPLPSSALPAHQMEVPCLEIRCFGPFELYLEGTLITPRMVRRRKALTLLKVLIAHGGRPLPKESLLEMLWPDDEPSRRTGQLYVLVHELRRLLEPSRPDGKRMYIQNDGDRYFFDFQSPCLLDVKKFRTLLNLAQGMESKGALEAAMAAYQAAVDLYRGDFMEDEPFAEWCWQEREHLREVCLDALRRLAALLGRFGQWTKSVQYLRRALRLDGLREELHRDLMFALWASGRRDEALRQYQACKEILRQELDVEPLPETRRLLERIRESPRPP